MREEALSVHDDVYLDVYKYSKMVLTDRRAQMPICNLFLQLRDGASWFVVMFSQLIRGNSATVELTARPAK
jgi:hypothetical protein